MEPIDSDAITPNIADFARTTIREIDEVSQISNLDELWASLAKYNAWNGALKPYLKERIDVLKNMSEINFSGKETVEQIGIRYLICGGIAKELQDIIDKVEQTRAALDNIKRS